MTDTARDERLQIMLTQDELQALDDWRFQKRMPSRAAAVRELLRRGLAAAGYDPTHARRSQDYGITGGATSAQVAQTAPPPRPNGEGSP